MTRLYLVGGTVRDFKLGLPPGKDIDFAVEAESYEEMKRHLTEDRQLIVWQERPEFVCLRGKIYRHRLGYFGGVLGQPSPHNVTRATIDADFTLCRKEAMYTDRRHPDVVTPTNILEDLSRRDFTINAMAVSEEGEFIDPFNGAQDCHEEILRAVGNARERFVEDPLRILRGLRFAMLKRLSIDFETRLEMVRFGIVDQLTTLPEERILGELLPMFQADPLRALNALADNGLITNHLFTRRLWLKPTLENR